MGPTLSTVVPVPASKLCVEWEGDRERLLLFATNDICQVVMSTAMVMFIVHVRAHVFALTSV